MTVDFSFFIRRARRHVLLILFAIAWLGAASRVSASQSVELNWAQSSSPNIVYYKVYFGTHSHNYTDSTIFDASISDVIIPGLVNGVTYYFAVTAIDDQNRESAFSNEASYNVPALGTLTLQVQGTTAAFRAVDATWTALADTDISGYAVKYGTQSGVYTNTVIFYGTTEGIIPNLPGGTIYFRVFPIDSYGIEPVGSAEVFCVMPTVVPLVLSAHVPTGSSGVELTWNAILNQGVAGYNLHYGTASHLYLYTQNCGSLTDFILHGLIAGQTYYFAVSPVDAFGNEGQFSSEAICVAPAPFPLSAQVHGSAAALQAVDVSWTASPDPDVNGYVIYYGTQTSVYDGSLFVSGTDDLLYGLTGGATNYFAVAPVDSFGVEPIASSQLSIFVPAVPNIVLHAQSTNSSKVHLNWNFIPNEGIVSYEIFYGSQSAAQGAYEYGGGYGYVNQVDIDGLAPNQTYYFAAIALDAFGNQTQISNEAMAITAPPPPMLLQTQTYTDGNGRPYLMEITTPAAVTGPWEVDSSTDMKHWTFYTNGTGYGYGSGYDVDAFVTINPAAPKMFFRVVN